MGHLNGYESYLFQTNLCLQPRAQNIANRGELQGSGIYQSRYLLYQKDGKA